jgi:hypothetical protein
MSPRLVRLVVIGVCIFGIAGMIVGSIADNNGTAITFGLIAATASLGLILVTAVVGNPAANARDDRHTTDEAAARALEAQVQALVDEGADEGQLRDLVRSAIRLGRGAHPVR